MIDSENLLAEILRLGLQQVIEAEPNEYIGVDHYERSEKGPSGGPRQSLCAGPFHS